MQTLDKTAVFGRVDALKTALKAEPANASVDQALHQCDRLRQAVEMSHTEGLRFAAFTLTRLMQQPGTTFSDSTQTAARSLKEALEAAGYGH